MVENELETIQSIFKTLYITTGIIAAIFGYLSTKKSKNEIEQLKKKLQNYWEGINKSSWIQIPEKVIHFLVSKLLPLIIPADRRPSKFLWIWIIISIITAIWFFFHIKDGLEVNPHIKTLFNYLGKAFKYSGIVLLIIILLFLDVFDKIIPEIIQRIMGFIILISGIIILVTIVAGYFFICVYILKGILELDTFWSIILYILLYPLIVILYLLSVFFLQALPDFKQKVELTEIYIIFILGSCFSIIITIIAMSIGHLIEPYSWVPKTIQMLLSNIFFDGITLISTFIIFSIAIKYNHILSIPLAILIDIIIASLCAVLSLYCGLVFSENQISFESVLYILVGRNPDSLQIELGPLFWVMHSAFIPTFIYLTIILIAWLGKIQLSFYKMIIKEFKGVENAYAHTASIIGIITAILVVISEII